MANEPQLAAISRMVIHSVMGKIETWYKSWSLPETGRSFHYISAIL